MTARSMTARSKAAVLLRTATVLLVGAVAVLLPVTPASADAIRDQQWYLGTLGIAAAHAITRGEGVTVAVVDSGVAADHPDLTGSVLSGIDARTNGGDGKQDPDGHGTAMAAVIAGHGHGPGNASGVLGIAPDARILPINISAVDARNGADPDVVARGIDFAVDHGAKVINASISVSSSQNLRTAVRRALDADVVVVASVGNEKDGAGTGTMGAPVLYEGVQAICSYDRQGNHASFSLPAQGDRELTICAPGVDGVSARPGGTYETGRSGTSMSAAIVSGVVALIRSKYPDLPAYEVVNRLTSTATDAGAPGRDALFGFGNVNVGAALTAQVAPTTSPAPWVRRSAGPSPTGTPGTSPPPAAEPSDDSGGVPVAALAGGGAVILLVLIGGVFLLLRRR